MYERGGFGISLMNLKGIACSLAAVVFVFGLPAPGQDKARGSQDSPYEKWWRDEVRWIITKQELSDFRKLTTDYDRDRFIADFWARRNPTPGATKNAFKEEHYRRLAHSNEHFAAAIQGSQ